MNWPSQTDPDLYGWSFAFRESQTEVDREKETEKYLHWLQFWNPPKEWLQ